MTTTTQMPELADFDPTTGHLHTCLRDGDPDAGCGRDCAAYLYAIACRAEQRLAVIASALGEEYLTGPTVILGDTPRTDPALSIRCPICDAAPGEPCDPPPGIHVGRRMDHLHGKGSRT